MEQNQIIDSKDKQDFQQDFIEELNKEKLSGFARFFQFLTYKLNLKKYLSKWVIFRIPRQCRYMFLRKTIAKKQILKFYLKDYSNYKLRDLILPFHISLTTLIISYEDNKGNENQLPVIQFHNQQEEIDQNNRRLLIYSHGNASDLGESAYFGQRLVEQFQVDVITYDYRGYGITQNFQDHHQNQVSEQGIYQDLEQILAYCVKYLNYELRNIILWGFSLGSAPTVEIGTRYTNIGKIVLQAPLSSILMVLDNGQNYKFKYNSKDMFCNLSKVQALKSKLFIFHGNQDKVLHIFHGKMLSDKYQLANHDCHHIFYICDGFGHNNLSQLIHQSHKQDSQSLYSKLNHFIDLQIQPSPSQLIYLQKEIEVLSYFQKYQTYNDFSNKTVSQMAQTIDPKSEFKFEAEFKESPSLNRSISITKINQKVINNLDQNASY